MTATFYDDPVAWEYFEEIEDFKRDIRRYGFVDSTPSPVCPDVEWDAYIYAAALAEQRDGPGWHSTLERSRGPGRRVRHPYWDQGS